MQISNSHYKKIYMMYLNKNEHVGKKLLED
jgi:hypothetical protein